AGEVYLAAAEGATAAERINLLRMAAEQYMVNGRFDEGLETLAGVLRTVGMSMPRKPVASLFSILWRRAYLGIRRLEFRERPASEISPELLLKMDACSTANFSLAPVDPIRGFDFQTRFYILALQAGDLRRYARAVATDVPPHAARGSRAWPKADA